MKTKEDLMFQKTRSIASIFYDAYQLYTENFKQLFRASWPIAVIYALVFALATFLFISDLLPIAVSLPDPCSPVPFYPGSLAPGLYGFLGMQGA